MNGPWPDGRSWDYALDAGRLPDDTANWWRLILRGKLKSTGKQIAGEKIGTAKRVLNASELGELIVWLPNFSRLVEEALTLYLWTGTRGAEIMAMAGIEVADTPAGFVWTIPKAKTKNARHENAMDLRVPLVGRAEKIVRRRKEQFGGAYLFPSEKGSGLGAFAAGDGERVGFLPATVLQDTGQLGARTVDRHSLVAP